jgi:hypothetical protein
MNPISDIAGKYRANPNRKAKYHECGFAAAAAAPSASIHEHLIMP